jgi:hypothetical protein
MAQHFLWFFLSCLKERTRNKQLLHYFHACSFFERIEAANEGGLHKALKALQHALWTVLFSAARKGEG